MISHVEIIDKVLKFSAKQDAFEWLLKVEAVFSDNEKW